MRHPPQIFITYRLYVCEALLIFAQKFYDIMTRRILILFALLTALSANAQTMRELFSFMPDSLNPMLTRVNREDFGDFLDSGMKAAVRNRFGQFTEMVKLTDDYLFLAESSASTVEMKLLPVNDSVRLICVVHSYTAPVEDSKVDFLSTSWLKVNVADYFTPPALDDFLITPDDEAEADTLSRVRQAIDLPLMKACLSETAPTLTFTLTAPDYLDRETVDMAKRYVKLEPVVYEWRDGRFRLTLAKKEEEMTRTEMIPRTVR